jgi:GNAT superfamily N-acetyltransferase
MTIRTVTPDDAPAVVAVTHPIDTTSIASPTSFRALLQRPAPATTERLVAEVDGAIVAWCPSGVHDDGRGWFWIGVAQAHRRTGIGAALFDRLAERLRDVPTLSTEIFDEDGRRFLERREFARTDVARLQTLDLTRMQLPEHRTDVLPLADLDPIDLYELYATARSDVPTRGPRGRMTRAEYERRVVADELLDHESSVVMFEDGAPVAFAFVESNRETGRGWHTMTGVRHDARGRGLGTAVKIEALRRARDAGVTTMLATNDVDNEPMLAINRALGFEPSVLVETYERAR